MEIEIPKANETPDSTKKGEISCKKTYQNFDALLNAVQNKYKKYKAILLKQERDGNLNIA